MTTNETKQKPIHEIRLGCVKAAIWENQTKNGGTRYGVTLTRLYKANSEVKTWSYSDTMGRDELPLACKVLDQAHSWIFDQAQKSDSE